MPKAKTQAGAMITHSGSRLDYDSVVAQCPGYVEAVGTTALPLGFRNLIQLNSRLDLFPESTG